MRAPFGLRRINKKCCLTLLSAVLIVATLHYTSTSRPSHSSGTRSKEAIKSSQQHEDYWTSSRRQSEGVAEEVERKDWHPYALMMRETQRRGAGEHGEPASQLADYASQERSINETGFNALLSDTISLQRALPDVRHAGCLKRTYLTHLPATSIIVIFYNEYLSVLLRTVHSLLNRTPAELLQEIILVDDCSSSAHLGNELEAYVREHFGAKLKLLRMRQRVGLVGARLAGARAATGDVLVFLDAHVEATHNWLPPLLEPIALDWHTVTTPIIDTLNFRTFAYEPQLTHGTRGHFNWQFNYVQLPLLPVEVEQLPDPHQNPVMNGGLFAIAAKFFWHLGGYDEQLIIWGAEQFELSFKIWMCGGRLLEVPCSRMAHLFRAAKFRPQYNRSDDFIPRNYKRVAEVWMDEYKQFLYERSPKLTQIDAGDLAARHALRKRLRCKSFKWFMQHVAPDLERVFPPVEPPDFGSGALQSLAGPKLCLGTQSKLVKCAPDLAHPYDKQRWQLNFRHELRQNNLCLEVVGWQRNALTQLWSCHLLGGNQYWFYDRQTQMLVNNNKPELQRCLEANLLERRAEVNACVFGKTTMHWNFGYINHTAMDREYRAGL